MVKKDTLILLGIGGAIAGVIALTQTSKGQEVMGAGTEKVTQIFETIKEGGTTIIDKTTETITKISEYPSELYQSAKDKVSDLIPDVDFDLSGISDKAGDIIENITEDVKEIAWTSFALGVGGLLTSGVLMVSGIGIPASLVLGAGSMGLLYGSYKTRLEDKEIIEEVKEAGITTIEATAGTTDTITRTISSGGRTVLSKAKTYAKTMPFMARQIERYERGEIALGG